MIEIDALSIWFSDRIVQYYCFILDSKHNDYYIQLSVMFDNIRFFDLY